MSSHKHDKKSEVTESLPHSHAQDKGFAARGLLPYSLDHDNLFFMNQHNSIQLPWLLVATPQLTDSLFKRKVVLIVEHSSTGSMGFVLNHKATAPLSDLVTVQYVKIPNHASAWMGGPVDRQSGVILAHRTLAQDTKSAGGTFVSNFAQSSPFEPVSETGYSLSSSEEALIELVRYFEEKKSPSQIQDTGTRVHPLAPNAFCELYPFRFLVGYSGWGKGQLEEEIKTGAWIQAPATPKLIFDTPWQSLWQECMNFVGVNPRAFAPSYQPFLH